ncbi:hypothetical protein D3C80_1576160 [compost metagenome]
MLALPVQQHVGIAHQPIGLRQRIVALLGHQRQLLQDGANIFTLPGYGRGDLFQIIQRIHQTLLIVRRH